MKEVKNFFVMLKSALKCIESIRITKWVKLFQNSESQHRWKGGGGVSAKLVKSQLFNFFNTSLSAQVLRT